MPARGTSSGSSLPKDIIATPPIKFHRGHREVPGTLSPCWLYDAGSTYYAVELRRDPAGWSNESDEVFLTLSARRWNG